MKAILTVSHYSLDVSLSPAQSHCKREGYDNQSFAISSLPVIRGFILIVSQETKSPFDIASHFSVARLSRKAGRKVLFGYFLFKEKVTNTQFNQIRWS